MEAKEIWNFLKEKGWKAILLSEDQTNHRWKECDLGKEGKVWRIDSLWKNFDMTVHHNGATKICFAVGLNSPALEVGVDLYYGHAVVFSVCRPQEEYEIIQLPEDWNKIEEFQRLAIEKYEKFLRLLEGALRD